MNALFTKIVLFVVLSSLSQAYDYTYIESKSDGVIELKEGFLGEVTKLKESQKGDEILQKPTIYVMASQIINVRLGYLANEKILVITTTELLPKRLLESENYLGSQNVSYTIHFLSNDDRDRALKQILSEVNPPRMQIRPDSG